ncbi:MAG: DivIVA domain-containing protein [Candidatus Humimicrobiaceae bacterium]
MAINSGDIQKKEFRIVFKGYKPEEVDKFLDLLAIEFDKLNKQNSELIEKIDKLKYETNNDEDDMKKVLQDALVSAHKVAEDIKQKAKFEAESEYNERKSKVEKEIEQLMSKKDSLQEEIEVIKSKYLSLKSDIESVLHNFKDITVDEEAMTENEAVEDDVSKEEVEEVEDKEEQDIGENDTGSREEEKDENEEEDKEEKNSESNIEEDDFDLKKKNKGVDIANPDVIDDFFKTDED